MYSSCRPVARVALRHPQWVSSRIITAAASPRTARDATMMGSGVSRAYTPRSGAIIKGVVNMYVTPTGHP